MHWISKPSHAWLFYLLWTAILVVSVHDGILVYAHQATIGSDERNPIGRWLLHLADGEIWLFLVVKALGTTFVGAILLLMFWRRPKWGWIACIALVILQGLLLWVLTST